MGRNSSSGQRRSGASSSSSARAGGSSGRISGGRTRNTSNISRGGSSSSGMFGRSTTPGRSSQGAPRRNTAMPPSNRHFSGGPMPSRGPGAFRHTPPPPRPHRAPPPPPRHTTNYTRSTARYSGSRRGRGCLSYIIAFGLLFGALLIGSFISNRNASRDADNRQTAQSVNHEGPIQENHTSNQTPTVTTVANAANYYQDHLDWISDEATLLTGLKEFEQLTGVTPFLYLTDSVNGDANPTEEELDTFVCDLYDQLFTDEKHFLLVFLEADDYYMTWYVCGNDAANTIDAPAAENVLDYIDLYYSNSSYTDEEYFSAVFSSAAKSITNKK